jgi:hypothetical protein
MHASYQIIIQVLWLAYTTQALHIKFKDLCQCKQAHEYAHIKCNQPSSWACSPYLCASLVQEFWSSSILQCCSLLIHVYACTLIFLSLSNISLSKWTYLCPNFSPFVINDHKRLGTKWNLYVKINGYHLKSILMQRVWDTTLTSSLDAKCLTWVDGWILNLHFWWTPPIAWNDTTCNNTCGSMKTTLKCHM